MIRFFTPKYAFYQKTVHYKELTQICIPPPLCYFNGENWGDHENHEKKRFFEGGLKSITQL